MKLFIILLFSLFTKLFLLNQFPTGITNDELHFVLNAKSVFLNFSNLADNWNPLSFKTIPNESSSELTFLVMAPFIGPLPTTLFSARLFSALLGTASVFLIFLISRQYLSKNISLSIAFIASLNPWLFYVSRTAFDAPISIFFLLLFIYLIQKLSGRNKVFSFIPLAFSFYTYIGIKPIIIFVSLFTTYFIYKSKSNQSIKPLLSINFLTILMIFIYYLGLGNSSSRVSELILPSSPSITSQVDLYRGQTTPNFLTPVFVNRYTVYTQTVLSKWANSFSPNLLFLKGDDTHTGSLQRHGYFYLFDALLLILGFYFLYQNHRRLFFYLISLLIIAPLPEAIRKDVIPAYVFHSALQFPILIIIAGVGFYQFFSRFKIIVPLYLLLFINLLFIYFYQYPNYAPQAFSYNNHLLSSYLLSENKDQNIVVVVKEPSTIFKNMIFYGNFLTKSTFSKISQVYQQGSPKNIFQYQNLIITSADNPLSIANDDIVVVEEGVSFAPPSITSRRIIKNISDNSPAFNIFNSTSVLNNPHIYQAF